MLSLPSIGYAQESKYSFFKSFASSIASDVFYIFSAPLRVEQKQGLKFLALTTATTVFVTSLDKGLDEDFMERDDLYVKPGIELAKIGDLYDKISSPIFLAGLTVPMLAGGVVFKDEKLLLTTRLLVESFFISGTITQLGKRIFGRARPYTGKGPEAFEPFQFGGTSDNRSFPSGHTTSAFSMMTVLAKQYDRWWIKIPAYSVALSVALQRIDTHNHWGADVIVGGAIGYWVGSTLVNRYKQQSEINSINPYFLGNRFGILLNFKLFFACSAKQICVCKVT